jgi:tetratricopeptide (TPR) repeat protein
VREQIVSQITRQLGAVVSKRIGLAVGLWGEPGIGKTHAAHAILEAVPCRHVTLHATAQMDQIVRTIPRGKTLPDWVEAQLERVGRGDSLEPGTLAGLLSASAPFVLHLEDLHEADSQRSALIQGLARVVGQTRGVALLVTSRSEVPKPFMNHRLEPLSMIETLGVLRAELNAVMPRDGLEWLVRRTRGNPLFVLEFSRYLRRQGFLWSDGERWHWRAPAGDFVPVTVEALIAGFVAGLTISSEAQTALRARAILPSELNPERLETVWAAVAGLSVQALEDASGQLERCGVLDGRRIVHPLVAETIARDLSDTERTRLARRALDALEPLDAALAADFVRQAGIEPGEAANRLERIADRLRERGELLRAARVYERATDYAAGERQARLALNAAQQLIDVDVPAAERLARMAMNNPSVHNEAVFLCAGALQSDRRHDAAWQLLDSLPANTKSGLDWWEKRVQFHSKARQNREAVRLWDERPDFHAAATVTTYYETIVCLLDLGMAERATELISRTLERPDLTPRERARILERRNFMFFRNAQYETVEQNLTEILGLMDYEAFPTDCATYYANRSLARVRLHKFSEARQDAERARQLALSTGVLTNYVGLAMALALPQIYLGEFQQAEEVLLEATEFAQHHSDSGLWNCYGHLSFLYLRWNAPHGLVLSRRYAQLSFNATRHVGNDNALVMALEDCVRAELRCDAPAAALEYARELERVAERTGLEEDATASAALLGRSLAALGQREAALPHLRRAAALYEAHGNHNEALSHALEIDRLEDDLESAQLKLVWFEAHGDTRNAARAVLYFPQLGAGPAPTTATVTVTVTAPARLGVLGAVTLELVGQPVTTRAKKRLEILAYLLETRIGGRSESSALELLDALYVGEPEPEAKNTLKQQVYLIRSSLGADSIISTPTGYALGNVSSDAEDALRTHESHLWRGPYLSNLGDGWRAGVREALSLELSSRVAALIPTDAPEAARLGAILIEMEPYDADALHLIVRALQAAGDRRGARRVYGEGRTRLHEIGEALPESLEAFAAAQTEPPTRTRTAKF